jgi:hypothetical protein
MDDIRHSTVSIEVRGSAVNPKMRKRTKTGCLTCRKRRIKCGEERPTCSNCTKLKRVCEGYNQRVVFKSPLREWPNSSLFGSQTPSYSPHSQNPTSDGVKENDPTRMLHSNLGFTRSSANTTPESCPSVKTRWYHTQISPNMLPTYQDVPLTIEEDIQGYHLAHDYDTCISAAPFNTSSRLMDAYSIYSFESGDAVEYMDDDYYDIESDEDSAICLADNKFQDYIANLEPRNSHSLISQGTLDLYRPHHTANPIKDPCMAQAFAYYVNITGPSLSLFGVDPDSRLWAVSLPTMALNNLGMLHGMLALSTLQVAHVFGISTTPSIKHYAYSLKRLHRAIADPHKQLQPSTIALLLASYELMVGDHVKWGSHIHGLSLLMREVDFDVFQHQSPKLCADLFWSCAKQDTYHSILTSTGLR